MRVFLFWSTSITSHELKTLQKLLHQILRTNNKAKVITEVADIPRVKGYFSCHYQSFDT